MLVGLAQWLQTFSPELGFLRVFQYLTFRAVMAALTALLIGLVSGPWLIRKLTEAHLVIGGGSEQIARKGRPARLYRLAITSALEAAE